MYKYADKKIVEILLKKDLEDIEKVYEIPHNIRSINVKIKSHKKWTDELNPKNWTVY